MLVQLPLWAFAILLFFAGFGALAIGSMIYFAIRKGDDK